MTARARREARLVHAIREICALIDCPPEDVAMIVLSPPWRITATVYVRDESGSKTVAENGDFAVRAVSFQAPADEDGRLVLVED